MINFYHVGGVKVHSFSRQSFATTFKVDSIARLQFPKLVFSMNGEGISRFHTDPRFRAAIETADLIHADGESVVRAGNRHHGRGTYPERVATTDAFHDIADAAAASGLTFYFLGATQEVNSKAIENVRSLYPALIIAGGHHGYFEDGSVEEEEIIKDIVSSKPDVLWVALGRPRQEAWCVRNRPKLGGITWLKTCGGLFDFLSEKSSRAPRWMINNGLEWLYRVWLEPRRLFIRYLTTNIHAMWCYRKFGRRGATS